MNPNMKITFIISIIANVLLAGMLLGDVSHHLVAQDGFNAAQLIARLPPSKRNLFESTMGPAKQRMDKERAGMAEAKKEAIRILKAEPFDPVAYLLQARHIDDMLVQMKQHMAESVVSLARQFTGNEREILAEIVSHPPFTMQPPLAPEKTDVSR